MHQTIDLSLFCLHTARFSLEGDRGAGGVRATGEERVGSGISTMAGSEREIQKGKLSLIVNCFPLHLL